MVAMADTKAILNSNDTVEEDIQVAMAVDLGMASLMARQGTAPDTASLTALQVTVQDQDTAAAMVDTHLREGKVEALVRVVVRPSVWAPVYLVVR